MKRVSVILIAAGAAAVLSGAGWRQRSLANDQEPHIRREVTRLRAHFDSVDIELRSRDPSALTPDRRASRAQLIRWLRDYRNAGRFPINDRFPRHATPIFRDSNGTLCAMAYLIYRSGRGDIVDGIARTRNNAFIPEMTDDPALVAWLSKSGLDVAEAARIQPAYDPAPVAEDQRHKVQSSYALASVGLAAAAFGSGTMNFVSPSPASGILGLIIGGAEIVVGVNDLDENRGTRKLVVANIGIGTGSALAGIRGLLASRNRGRSTQGALTRQRTVSDVRLSPDLLILSGVPRFGVSASARF